MLLCINGKSLANKTVYLVSGHARILLDVLLNKSINLVCSHVRMLLCIISKSLRNFVVNISRITCATINIADDTFQSADFAC